uniref:Uncharacterized protein n=1 Tax=Angiostrongylus cantonensis TaxID=6313 RepID=A0A0K0CYB1_ANGCA
MSVASASAYSLTDSDEMINAGMTTNLSIQEADLQTALEDADEVTNEAISERNLPDHGKWDSVILRGDQGHLPSTHRVLAASRVPAVWEDTHMDSNVKTARMATSVHISSLSETDVDMERKSSLP